MTATSAAMRTYDRIDLSSRAFWSTTAAERERSFAVLRAERPVSWHPPVEDALMQDPDDRGYWAITRRADIVTVSRTSEVFQSGKGVIFENVPEELLEASQSFLAMDPPQHTKLRKLVSAAFTPRQVRRIEDSIKANAKTIPEHNCVPSLANCSGSCRISRPATRHTCRATSSTLSAACRARCDAVSAPRSPTAHPPAAQAPRCSHHGP